MRHLASLMLACCLLIAAGTAQAGEGETRRAREALRVLDEIMQAPDRRLPGNLLKEAYAVAVIPDVLKAGFVIGGRHGQGLIAVKSADGTWSNPSFVSMGGGSVGFQAGVQSTDVVLVFRSQRGVESIVHGKFTLGADAAVAAGPVGRDAQASTDAQLKAEIYSYSRARGLFAGVALDGSAITIDDRSNRDFYGRKVSAGEILNGKVSTSSNGAQRFHAAISASTSTFSKRTPTRLF